MPSLGLNGMLDWLRRRVLADVPCAELVERFVTQSQCPAPGNRWGSNAEDAFAELVRRHGPKVYGICRRIVGDHQLAEDAFQATFVVLSKKAASIRPRSAVGAFLYGVARKAALKASAMSRRKLHESLSPRIPNASTDGDVVLEADVLKMLDEEIANLPDAYRAAVVLCEIDGVSRATAANQLGIKEGTLSSRLAAARKRLKSRLLKRGVVLSIGTLSFLAESARASVPGSLTASAADLVGTPVSDSVSSIAQAVVKSMLITKLKAMSVVGAVIVLVSGMGVGVLTARERNQLPPRERIEQAQVGQEIPRNDFGPEANQKKTVENPPDAQQAIEKARKVTSYPLAILPFEEKGTGVKDMGAKVSDLLFARLSPRPEMQLVDRGDMKKVLEEHELNLSGAVKSTEALRIGQLTGAKLLVTGSVLSADQRIYLIAKVISTETTRVLAASVDGKASDDLGPLVQQLGDKIAETVRDQGGKIVPQAATREDRLASLKSKLKNGPRPAVMVNIPERHVGIVVPDPAAQTEMMRTLKETGFSVLDSENSTKGKADILMTGEGISEFAVRRGNLVSVKARVEIKAVDRQSGRVLASDSQVALAIDLTEQLAGKAALQEAAEILAERILPKLQMSK